MQDPKCTVPYVIQTGCTKYINLVGAKKWNVTSAKDTKIITLTTSLNDHKSQFNELKLKMASGGGGKNYNGKSDGGSGGGKTNDKLKVPGWWIKFKGKTTIVDDKKWV